ncbi:PEP-CTERM sorting domain-containing protein [Roseateles oligotrophus]|uniref:PEP-CTERM sorting domain-containing protein n=1 Tax=Roseateles oligotrophus TaxID=1769250 RepID=A0ABT2YM51_9BURK|nr:PEP-CTERM sorting domain-containing protein [Roseateles oligotrophus]MCV2371082.1 PEP-CTERM sorting domain-containing protein [Roseateles oligotrophus]
MSLATVFGSLGNFDTVNDTGKDAWGFEIDIEDLSFDQSKITSVFGYNRVFSFISPDPGAVVRFGKPTITDVPGYGVRIIYGGTIGGVATPFNNPLSPFVTTGESCWPGANAGWKANPCDHFGVSTYGNPAAIKYSWLVDNGSGTLVKQAVGVPSVSFVPVPVPGPPPPIPAAVQALIKAPVLEAPAPFANAFWVKLTQTTLPENVDLGDLLIGDHPGHHEQIAALNNKPESETEWYELQIGRVDELSKELKPNGDPSLVIDMKFYKYQGQFDDEGLVDPLVSQKPHVDENGVAYVMLPDENGILIRHDLVYVGQQVGGFNANELAAPIPEPEVYAMLLAGLGLLSLVVRRRHRADDGIAGAVPHS